MSTQMERPDTPRTDGGAAGDSPRPPVTASSASSAGSAWRVVAAREIVTRLTDKAFLVSTTVTLVVIIAAIGLQFFIASRPSTTSVATTTPAAAKIVTAAQADARAAGHDNVTFENRTVGSDAAARAAVESEDVDAALSQAGGKWTLTTKGEAGDNLQQYLTQAVRDDVVAANAAKAGTTEQTLTAGSALSTQRLEVEKDDQQQGVTIIVSMVFAFLFYLSSLIFGSAIANSVVVEKQSRIVEILVSAIPVRQLLIGKVAGNTILAVGQMVLFVGVGLVALAATPLRSMLPLLLAPSAWFVVFFLIGFLSLACVWAVCGALAGRTEDLQATSTPMTMLVMAAFFLGLWAKGTLAVVVSYVPVISSIVMPGRILAGTTQWWEPIVSLLITVAFGAVMIVIGERIYRRALLQTGGRLTWRKAWQLEE